MGNTRVFRMSFASVYPHYVAKVEKKGRTKEERYHHPRAVAEAGFGEVRLAHGLA